MLPDFDDDGCLPLGIHHATLTEVVERFGAGSPERVAETMELSDFVSWAKLAGIKRLVIDGSYTTTAATPNDLDLVILPGEAQPEMGEAALDSSATWPFLHIQVAVDFQKWALGDFGSDRRGKQRGVVEISL